MNFILILAVTTVVCSSSAMEVEKAFKENEIVPDTLQVAPKKLVNVSSFWIENYFFLSSMTEISHMHTMITYRK